MEKFTLLIETTDAKGLVYNVSKVLFEHGLNIDKNSEYVDSEENKFFMRTVISGEFNEAKLLKDIKGLLPQNHIIKLKPQTCKDIVLLVTKESHVLGDILIRYVSGELNANIKAVVSNHDHLRTLVEKFDIPYHFVDTKDLAREEHEQKLINQIDVYNPEIIVLAKYMRILTSKFVGYYEGKVLNIHHSFLPAFIGANPYKQAHSRGVKIIGATAHYVTNDLDEGPIIFQDITRVDHTYSWQDMRNAGRNVEKVVLSNALQLLLDDKVLTYSNKTVIL
ncbi:MAG: formyltetrahydrofolate deformylase [Campylobacteraceae bacterium]|nr:formyltetrahydrofolate deformylase [Campylobacteraceae bacterium]MBT3882096.1 formyltetrahydrofolate deformylase [Campylobacteraceae bacterium]MBT4030123.1 formyltetrahydrofolate deformylase [Campylobacteraceae bacterium]MBT4178803.1 formyltetrahydrofolate deformylase [Campylobacteraceae bacterium]MBT4572032.1 formyltetrahydrofolate deformylase [Campylobacteraceae bacterium]